MAPGRTRAALAVLVACGEGDEVGPSDATSGCEVVDPIALVAGREHACEDQPLYDPEISTATSYFLGDFRVDGTKVSGTERWVLFANETWEEAGGFDCTVVWTASGTTGTAVNRGDLALDLVLAVDERATDCPTDDAGNTLYAGDEVMEVVYDLRVDGCESTVFFPSGTRLGAGAFSERRVTYASSPSCLLF